MNPFTRFWRSGQQPTYHPVRCEVLVVEDDKDQAELLCGLLRMQNVVVSWAWSLAGALSLLEGPDRFQLAFVDLGLPNGSGCEVVRLIKERRRMTHVVVVSGADPDKIAQALDHGYVGVLSKPYSISAIREVLFKHRLPCAD